jgi:broad specificity phosphatase PhoE
VANRAQQWLESQRHAPVTIAVTHEMLSRSIQGAYAQLTPDETLGCNHPHDRIYRLHEGKVDEILC